MTLRDLIEDNASYDYVYEYDYSYKNQDSELFADLDEVLEEIWYRIDDEWYTPWEYNDIKAYLDCSIKKI